jgi:hypothetical protein
MLLIPRASDLVREQNGLRDFLYGLATLTAFSLQDQIGILAG